MSLKKEKEAKTMPVTFHGSPQDCEVSSLPQFLDKRFTDGGEVVSLTRRSFFTPSVISLVLNSVRGIVDGRKD
jgi:hypothetical protein